MLAIIGGTGIYDLPGMPSTNRSRCRLAVRRPLGRRAAGPSERPARCSSSRATAAATGCCRTRSTTAPTSIALKRAGATQILGFSAVGSLAERIAPGDFAVPNQYFDWTKGERQRTLLRRRHRRARLHRPAGQREPGRLDRRQPRQLRHPAAPRRHLRLRRRPAARHARRKPFLRQAGCQLVGMTNVPEVFLAREAQICYATVGIVTDYDCWMEDPSSTSP